jgi:hypothetical protein
MSRQPLIALASTDAVVFLLAMPGVIDSQAAGIDARTSRQDGVTITVEPKGLPQGAKTWDFAVTLETHTQDLDDDLVQSTTLLADGTPHRPLGWNGPPPGGHHRKGVLRFAAVTPLPQVVELQIRREGESAPRIFRWQTME